jgi:hypothetical protein
LTGAFGGSRAVDALRIGSTPQDRDKASCAAEHLLLALLCRMRQTTSTARTCSFMVHVDSTGETTR